MQKAKTRSAAQIRAIKNVSELYDLTPAEIKKVKADPELLRVVTAKMTHAAQKQLKRLEAAPLGTESPAYVKFKSTGAKLTTRGSSPAELVDTFNALRDLRGKKTATASGWKKLKKKTEERVSKSLTKVQKKKPWTEAQQKKFWKAYRRVAGTLNLQKIDSDTVQKAMRAIQAGDKKKYIKEINEFNGRLQGMSLEEINNLTRKGQYISYNTADGKAEIYGTDLRSIDSFTNLVVTWTDMKLERDGSIAGSSAQEKYNKYKQSR